MDNTPDKPLKEVSGQLPDADLVKIALKGDKSGFQGLVERYYKPVFGYLYLRTYNYHTAEEITQEVFLRGYRFVRKLSRRPGQFGQWIFTIARNCHLEWLREQKKKIDYQIESAAEKKHNPDSADLTKAEQKEELKHLLERLKELPEPYYLVLSMKYQKEMSADKIARALGQPVGTVTSTLTRAYKLMREGLKDGTD